MAPGASAQTTNYTVSNIVTNVQDSRLVNPWGLSRPSKSSLKENEWWTSDQVTGLSTLYYANGTIVGLQVAIPPASGSGPGSPTGTAFNPNNHDFAFVTLDGTISNWSAAAKPAQPGKSCAECHVTTATIMVNNSAGASYQGLTIAKNATSGAQTYYAANANGGIEAYDATSFAPVTLPPGAFTDKKVPKTYSPAGIQAIGSKVYVTYNAIAGGGTGYVDAYNTNGKLLLRLEQGWFNQPWGVALAPANFGQFSGMLLVGNTGSGWIGAYNPTTGAFQGFLTNGGQDVTLPGLGGWSLAMATPNPGRQTCCTSTLAGPTRLPAYLARLPRTEKRACQTDGNKKFTSGPLTRFPARLILVRTLSTEGKEGYMQKITLMMLGAAALLYAGAQAQTGYTASNIVTDVQDSNLINPWGISRAAGKSVAENQWWVSDQVTGVSTLYDATGTIVGLTVKIPPASGTGVGSPHRHGRHQSQQEQRELRVRHPGRNHLILGFPDRCQDRQGMRGVPSEYGSHQSE